MGVPVDRSQVTALSSRKEFATTTPDGVNIQSQTCRFGCPRSRIFAIGEKLAARENGRKATRIWGDGSEKMKKFRAELAVGDVVIASGNVGKLTELGDFFVKMEVAKGLTTNEAVLSAHGSLRERHFHRKDARNSPANAGVHRQIGVKFAILTVQRDLAQHKDFFVCLLKLRYANAAY